MCEENAPPSPPLPLPGHDTEGQSHGPGAKAEGRDVEDHDHVKLMLNEVLESESKRET